MKQRLPFLLLTLLFLGMAACAPTPAPSTDVRVLAVESFLTDITQHVAGSRLTVDTLIPSGLDPHAFEATPQDVALYR